MIPTHIPRLSRIAGSIALIFTLSFHASSHASVSTPQSAVKSAVEALERRYHHAGTLKAVFFESYTDGHGSSSAESGTVYFSRPGRMRWDYESPEPKLFLVDGANVWFYVPADHTASRAKLSQSSDWRTPLALLAGKADLSKLCRAIEPGGEAAESSAASTRSGPDAYHPAPADTVLRCIPRASPESETIREVLFEIDPGGFLVRVLIIEAGNASTEFRFGNWQENITIPEAQFHFEPPRGVAVVDEESLAATIH